MPLPPGVTVVERGWLSANNIVFTGDGPAAVVDTGYSTHAAQTVALVGQALDGRSLDLILSTHLHSDHCGGNAALQRAYLAAQTAIPPGLAKHVHQWDPVALTYTPTGQVCEPFTVDALLSPGSEVELGALQWQVHSAPGHDPHSVILFEPQTRTLVSADALWENGFGVVFQELEGERAFDEVAATLDLIESLDPVTVIPGHGRVFGTVRESLASARRRLDGFVRDPQRHALHAAKVLVKFKLLESQRLSRGDLQRWAEATPYLGLMHDRWFATASMDDWLRSLADDLVRAGAATLEGEYVINA